MNISYQFLVTSLSFSPKRKTNWRAALEASVWNVVQFSGVKRFAGDAQSQEEDEGPRGHRGVEGPGRS